jgi:hypothetical protein
MIRDLLEASRVESGKVRIEPRCIAVRELVQQAITMMTHTAKGKHVALEVEIDDTMRLVYADPDRVLQVLINLIDNAIKFTPAEGSVTVKACQVEADPNCVYLSVTDTGCGISPEAKHLIFERLYQEGTSIDSTRTGLGLGLYISKELVKLHGGRIWVASEVGQGSTFSFTLPLFSLANLLSPVITYQGRLRDSIILLAVQLAPNAKTHRSSWKKTCQQCRETLQRCIYVDKDLLIPISGSDDSGETLFVAASTDLEHAEIMMKRIREQLEAGTDLKNSGTVTVKATAVSMPSSSKDQPLETLVQAVADSITEQVTLARKPEHLAKMPAAEA